MKRSDFEGSKVMVAGKPRAVTRRKMVDSEMWWEEVREDDTAREPDCTGEGEVEGEEWDAGKKKENRTEI